MKEKLTIVKLGGNCMDEESLLSVFLSKFAALPGNKILVHGGGKIATSLGKQLNIPVEMIEGRRVTTKATLEVVTMVYAGLLNKNIVARLQSLNCNAFGLCGADGNLIVANKRGEIPIDYGFVGDPVSVNSNLLKLLLSSSYVAVIAPITHDSTGQLLNTNADTIASVVACSLSDVYDVHLLFAFDKKGVLNNATDDSSVIRSLQKSDFVRMKSNGQIHSGMLPKLDAGFKAINSGVAKVTLQHVSSLNSDSPVTQLLS